MSAVAENLPVTPTPLRGYYTTVGKAINTSILKNQVWQRMEAITAKIERGLNYWESQDESSDQVTAASPVTSSIVAAESFALAIKAKTVLRVSPVPARRARAARLPIVPDVMEIQGDVIPADDEFNSRRTSPVLLPRLKGLSTDEVYEFLDTKWRREGVLPKAG